MRLIREYFMTTLGVIVVAIGICFFLIPANLATGGITGLAMVINHLMPSISIGVILLFLNIILFAVGFIAIGPQFGAKTIYASFLLTGVIYIFDTFFKLSGPMADDLLVNLIVGILIQGIGLGIVFNQNASTGGTDIIAKVLNKFMHFDIGKSLLMADFVVVILAGLTFGLNLGIYAFLGIVFNGVIIDNVIEGFSIKVSVSIISKESDQIQKYIVEIIERGATIYTAKGAYTMSNKEIITSVMSKKEFIRLKRFIKEIDKDAFVMISNVREVLGEGFYS
ncbi:YitT family protein [Fusibacter ferrireducens]|uniref:YitT family protein n=1 Tax=Fusibacter ferrireducens TaxID=2785058 RepID=A0ABR9ZXH0_9FIRM|nr:YitT family protein [Fusibacter ferrireducens]MBF4694294.1 YitT family protein [Fusibacter ferrireducens]